MTQLRLWEVRMYRPYSDEIPWDLLEEAGFDAGALTEQDQMRVAKLNGQVIGAYVLRALSASSFCLLALVVDAAYRRRGMGRWLLGHAIGLAESKGGRELVVGGAHAPDFFTNMGFHSRETQRYYAFTPE